MRSRRDTPGGGALMGMIGGLVRLFYRTVGRTWRLQVVEGREILAGVLERDETVIFTFWHNRSAMAVPLLLRHFRDEGYDLTLMVSASRDGELVARTAQGWGVGSVRGSASRGGRGAMRGAYRAIQEAEKSPVVVPDGPRGPAYVYKPGALHLARLSGARLLPMGFAADRYRAIRSWDRLMIPMPFARVAIAVGTPMTVTRDADDDAMEGFRAAQEDLLNRLTAMAEDALGVPCPPEVAVPRTGSRPTGGSL